LWTDVSLASLRSALLPFGLALPFDRALALLDRFPLSFLPGTSVCTRSLLLSLVSMLLLPRLLVLPRLLGVLLRATEAISPCVPGLVGVLVGLSPLCALTVAGCILPGLP
jgi:hypothetical protein